MDPEAHPEESAAAVTKPTTRGGRRRSSDDAGTQPRDTTSQPRDTTSQPRVTTSQQPDATSEPPTAGPGLTAADAPTPAQARTVPAVPPENRLTELRATPGQPGQRPPQRPADLRIGEARPPAEHSMPTNIYRARRPAVAAGLIIPAVLVGLLLVRGLAIAAFGPTFSTAGVIASSLGLAALPMLVSGLYGLVTGAAFGAEQFGFKVWARPPLAYLLVGLVFVVGAGLAIG